MKPFIYSISVFFLLIALNVSGQSKYSILDKSFDVNEQSILNLDLTNIAVLIEESFDDKIHFNYEITFGRYSKRKQKIIKGQIKASTKSKGNLISLTVNNSAFLGVSSTHLSMDSLTSAIKDYAVTFKSKKNMHKTKDSLLSEIRTSGGSDLRDFINRNRERYEDKEFLKTRKIIIQTFKIKVPKYVQIRLKGIESNVTVKYDVNRKFIANTFKGTLKVKNVLSDRNTFSITNGIFQAESLSGGNYSFKDAHKILIGKVSNLHLTSEASKLEIGEVEKNVQVTDFNSKLYFYNFNNRFGQLKYDGDYSELFFYNLRESNSSVDVYGHNTALNMDDIKTTFGLSKEKKITKILEKKVSKDQISSGNIHVKLLNGIVNIFSNANN